MDNTSQIAATPPVTSNAFRVELKVPHEKIEQAVIRMREELVVDVDRMKGELSLKMKEIDEERQRLQEQQERILTDSKSELEQCRLEVYESAKQDGHQRGFDEGFSEGRDQVQKEFNSIKEDFIHHTKEIFYKIQELNEYKQAIFEKTEPYLISLIETIVKKVITVEMSIHPDLILDVIREAAVRISDVPHLKINVHPQHAQYLKEKKDVLRNKLDIVANIEIISNESLHPGGCQLEADYGLVDASVEIKMISLLELLNKVYDSRHIDVPLTVPVQELLKEENPEDDDALFTTDDDSLSFSETDVNHEDFAFLTEDDEDSDEDVDDDMDDDIDDSNDDFSDNDEDETVGTDEDDFDFSNNEQ